MVVTNALGSVTSSNALVTAAPIAPGILSQPVGGTLPLGGTWALSVSASGDAPLAYQWRKDGIVINEGTGSLFAASSPGAYSVVVTNALGSVISSNALVTAAPIAPGILSQPVGKNLSAGESLTLMVTATGTAPLNYQWMRNGVGIEGATQPTFAPTDTGSYSVVISNHVGAITSLTASVRVPRAIISEYEGLLTPSSSTHTDVAGTVSVSISRSGAVSGKIRSRSGVIRFVGKINQYGQITFAPHSTYWLPLMNGADIKNALSLEIISKGTGNCLSGKVASSADNAAEILATLSAVPVKAISISHRGRYTALFQNVENQQTGYPEGDGYALFGVSAAGLTLAGQLADASRVSAFVKLSEDLTAPLFIPLYKGKGLIMGNLEFDYSQLETDVTCFGMRWFKPGGVSFPVNYPKGWPSGISVDFIASRYDSRKSLGDFISLGAELNFSAAGGNLEQQAYGKAKFLLPAIVSVPQPSSINLKVRFDLSTGGLLGSFIPTGAKRPVMFSGLVLQKANFASGFFLRDGESGVIQLGP